MASQPAWVLEEDGGGDRPFEGAPEDGQRERPEPQHRCPDGLGTLPERSTLHLRNATVRSSPQPTVH
jgi:hypothetical protein